MTTVRMLVKLSGSRNGAEWPAVGDTLEVPAEEAAQLANSRLAAVVADTPAVETAAFAAPENAAMKRGPGRPRKEG